MIADCASSAVGGAVGGAVRDATMLVAECRSSDGDVRRSQSATAQLDAGTSRRSVPSFSVEALSRQRERRCCVAVDERDVRVERLRRLDERWVEGRTDAASRVSVGTTSTAMSFARSSPFDPDERVRRRSERTTTSSARCATDHSDGCVGHPSVEPMPVPRSRAVRGVDQTDEPPGRTVTVYVPSVAGDRCRRAECRVDLRRSAERSGT